MLRYALIVFLFVSCIACGPGEKANTPPPPKTLVYKGQTFVVVPEGDYVVGEEGLVTNPRRTVHLQSFAIAINETTNRQFAAFVDSTGFITDAEHLGFGKTAHEGMLDWQWEEEKGACWKFPFGPDEESIEKKMEHPVTQISGADAEAYCKWAGLRLPTIEEWEVAARAGATTRYPWGDELHEGDRAHANVWEGESHRKNKLTDGFMYTAPVKSFAPNAWGLYDVIGNVFEYCDGDLPNKKADSAGVFQCGRGGSWWCSTNTCSYFNLVSVGRMVKHGSLANQGFRAVLQLK